MRKSVYRYLFHFFCYYIAWLSSILFAKNSHPWGGPIVISIIIIVQFLALKSRNSDKKIIYFTLCFTITGFLIDTIFVYCNYIHFLANPLKPFSSPWMIGLWINFSIIFYDCCFKYFKHIFILGILSLFGFPAAYYAGIALKAATLPNGSLPLVTIGLIWGILLPSICYLFYRSES